MSNLDRLLLFLHVGAAIFTLGPITAATMATPRYIRRRDVAIVRYLHRATRIYGLLLLLVFLFGLFLAGGQFDQVWLSASMTLFIVAAALLVIVERDQRSAISELRLAAAETAKTAAVAPSNAGTPHPDTAKDDAGDAGDTANADGEDDRKTTPADEIAKVETGRIATISGVIALIWLVILALMVFYS